MGAESPAFDRTCEALQERTNLDRLEASGTVRIALKVAGLDGASVDPVQMVIVLRKVLPSELEPRGISDAAAHCEEIAEQIEGMSSDTSADRVGAAAATIGRFGG
jgi:hypothetical protein